MNTKKILVLAALALVFVTILPVAPAKAQCCNPLLLPFAVAATAVGTAAAIATAPFHPYWAPVYAAPPPPAPVYYYYRPAPAYYPARSYYPGMWVPGHYTPYGGWAPGHWMYR